MPNSTYFSTTLRFLIGAAAIGIAVVTVQPYAWLLNSVILGVLIVVISAPMLYWLRHKGLPGWLALLIMLLVLAVKGARPGSRREEPVVGDNDKFWREPRGIRRRRR